MDYKKIYDDLINNAKSKNRTKLNKNDSSFVYYENHHIIPKCLGGLDNECNLVLLTAKEHYIAHKLLVEIYDDPNLIAVMLFMINPPKWNKYKDYVVTQREKEYFNNRSKGSGNVMYGMGYKLKGELNGRFGMEVSEETRTKISKANKGKISFWKGSLILALKVKIILFIILRGIKN